MERKKGQEKLSIGDKVMILHMEEERIRPGSIGVVKSITKDPFESDNEIINISWENGSSLSILSKYDRWKIIEKSKLNEAKPERFFRDNPDIFENFDYKFFRDYLLKLRESGIVNMLGASSFLYSGAEHIDRYYGENPPDSEAFQEVLEMANTAKDKMIQGTVKSLTKKGVPIELENVQREIKKYANKILQFYISFI